MSTDANKAFTQRRYAALDRNDQAALDELIAPASVDHALPPGMPPTRDSFKQVVAMFRAASSGLHHTVEDVIVEGDRVVARSTIRGVHTGGFFGVAATGKQATLRQIHIGRIANGKLVEHWGQEDDLGRMQQLGAIPKQPAPA